MYANKSNSKTGGAGIGLSIAKSIVEGHRGRITAYSRDGHTLEILVTLPLISFDFTKSTQKSGDILKLT